ncbi:Cdc15p [Rhizophagus irregularis DAOM 197198w]|uniref:Cdc15p n=2 Tax=Rhizophagus irregularis TaxID=588596 RepID=A0A015L548_RHIIW|nr:Cdc15p [Rhizophagus irregularis DAOM 197198w]
MKLLKEWIDERIYDINYFVYNEFNNLEEIDEGTSGTFKKANLKNQRITVAIKSLNNSIINENDFNEFITKLKTFQKINHPNINHFLGLTRDPNDNYFLVWEYANEGNLRNYLKNKFNMLRWNDKIQMALDIALGLMFLHSEQIIHGNLHAYNILIKSGRLMITDFELSVDVVYFEPQYLRDPRYKRDKKSDIYSLGILLWELSSGHPPFSNYGQEEFSSVQTLIINGKREDPVENTPFEYQQLYQKCWCDDSVIRPGINEVREILSQMKLRFDTDEYINEIFKSSLTQQQIIRKFKLNNGLILTEGNIQSSMQAIFVEDGALNMSLYEGQPIVYLNINDLQPADVCINFPIAEMAYKGDLLESFSKCADNDNDSFGHFFARKILVGGKLFIKEFSSATQTQKDILKFYLFHVNNLTKYSIEIQFNNLFSLNLLPKIVTLDGEELDTYEKLIKWMNDLYQNKIIDIISYDLIPISQLRHNALPIDDLNTFNEKQPGVTKFKEKLSLEEWVGDGVYCNLMSWTEDFHLFQGLIINEDYEIKISKKIAVDFVEIPKVNINNKSYQRNIKPLTNLEDILISNNIFSIKNLSTFPFIKNNFRDYGDYIHILFKCERYEILLDKDLIKPTKEFKQAIESALSSTKPLKILRDILNEYGHLFPQRIILGSSLKSILPSNSIPVVDLEKLTFDDLNISYLLTQEGEVIEINDLSKWIQNTDNSLEIIEFDNIIPLYKILEVEQQKKIDDILKNDFRIIMTGITDLKDLDNNDVMHYKRINLNSESSLGSEDYKVFGSIISENNTKSEEIYVNFGLYNYNGFYAIIKKLEISVDIKKYYVLWMVVGSPSKLSIFSPNNREFSVGYIKESITLRIDKSNHHIKAPFQLFQGYTIFVHAYYSSTNYEPISIIKLVEWNDQYFNISIQSIIDSDAQFDGDKIDLHVCILSTDNKNLKIDREERECSLNLIGYMLTKENLNEKFDYEKPSSSDSELAIVQNMNNDTSLTDSTNNDPLYNRKINSISDMQFKEAKVTGNRKK